MNKFEIKLDTDTGQQSQNVSQKLEKLAEIKTIASQLNPIHKKKRVQK